MKTTKIKVWKVEVTVTDTPEEGESFMTKSEILDEVLSYGGTSAGIKISEKKVALVKK